MEGVFTPTGELKILVVCIGFGNEYDRLHNVSNWNWQNQFPDMIMNGHAFYDNYNLFNTPLNAERDKENISRFYYEASNHKLKVIFKPVRINVSPPANYYSTDFFSEKSIEIMDTLSSMHRSGVFNWTEFDNRRNKPKFLNNYSNNNSPDNKIDFTIFIFRWDNESGYTAHIPANIGGIRDGYEITNESFLLRKGGRNPNNTISFDACFTNIK